MFKLMASIIPGFEHDIFISHRHTDNLDGWVHLHHGCRFNGLGWSPALVVG